MIVQSAITILGLTAIYLSQEKQWSRRRWASVVGLASQPFWFIAAWQSELWGIFILAIGYTLVWFKGFHTHWINPGELVKEG